jgi:hypothetical protein
MKDTDKVTLTVGQLKKLVIESRPRYDLSDKERMFGDMFNTLFQEYMRARILDMFNEDIENYILKNLNKIKKSFMQISDRRDAKLAASIDWKSDKEIWKPILQDFLSRKRKSIENKAAF